jgi:hypothetical protein
MVMEYDDVDVITVHARQVGTKARIGAVASWPLSTSRFC